MSSIDRPAWWPTDEVPVPADWVSCFTALAEEPSRSEWGLRAAVHIASTRKRTGHGPSFAELFEHLLPENGGLPSPVPAEVPARLRREVTRGFRYHVALEWRRAGWISWSRTARSLRVGRAFREASRAYRRSRLRADSD